MKEKYSSSSPSPSSKLSLHRDSRLISKPKIRIIHVVAPEIINIDAANFRELVQALTGKPSSPSGGVDQCSNLNKEYGGGDEDDLLNEFVNLDGFVQLHHEFPFMSKSLPHYHLDLGTSNYGTN